MDRHPSAASGAVEDQSFGRPRLHRWKSQLGPARALRGRTLIPKQLLQELFEHEPHHTGRCPERLVAPRSFSDFRDRLRSLNSPFYQELDYDYNDDVGFKITAPSGGSVSVNDLGHR